MSGKGGNIWFDPLISKHQTLAATLRKKYAAPIGPIPAEHLPGYQAPRTPASSNHVSTETLIDDEYDSDDQLMSMAITLVQMMGPHDTPCLSIVPSTFEMHVPRVQNAQMPSLNLSNSELSQAECRSTRFPWILYGFNSGHFFSAIQAYGLPYDIILAGDTDYVDGLSSMKLDAAKLSFLVSMNCWPTFGCRCSSL